MRLFIYHTFAPMNTLSVHFAPLQGYTDAVYRNAHALFFGGVDHYYTPFVRIERGAFRNKDLRDIAIENNQVASLIPQLIASDADEMQRLVCLFIEKGYKEVDINLGCPFPMLVKRKKGSGMLPHPEMVRELLTVAQQYPEVQFSVKMRLGLESAEESVNLLPILNDAPLKQVIMHPRLGVQQYKGEVDIESFGLFYEGCNHPLVYNGDVKTMEDIDRVRQLYPKLSGIMIGRGLLTNPALAAEYKEGVPLSSDGFLEKMAQMHRYVYEQYRSRLEGGEGQLLTKMKTFWEYPYPGIDGKTKKRIHKCTRLATYDAIVGNITSWSI